ncbi:MAG TPA: hypothetical protein VE967_03960 [Gemmatimonadaceae bacterium]|nr:hypothetical protein [Gemmatimonadaceae bacterium]
MIIQLISLLGAVLVLGAYLALQLNWLGRRHRTFHAMNFLGSAMLTYVAIPDGRLGLIVVEGVWALLSLPGTIRPPST